jgi:propanediol dehydratase small subunit
MSYLYKGKRYTSPRAVWLAAEQQEFAGLVWGGCPLADHEGEYLRMQQEQEMHDMCVDSTLDDRIEAQRMAQPDDNIMEVYNAI